MAKPTESGDVSISDVMDYAERVSLSELSELALFANAGNQAIGLARQRGVRDELCRQLAAQALELIRRVPALEKYGSVFRDLLQGTMPNREKMAAARGLMVLVAVMFRRAHDGRERQHDRDRGVRWIP